MKTIIIMLYFFSQISLSQDNSTEWNKVFKPGLGFKQDGTIWQWGLSNIRIYKNQEVNRSLLPHIISNYDEKWIHIGTTPAGAIVLLNENGEIWLRTMSSNKDGLEKLGNDNDWNFIQNIGANDLCIYAIKKNGSLWRIIATHREIKIEQTSNDSWTYVQGDECGGAILGLKVDGTLWSWGRFTPAFGLNDYCKEPKQIGVDNDWKIFSIANGLSGAELSAFIKTNGTLWFMGETSVLFKGFLVFKPTQFDNDSDWSTVSVSREHVLAIKNNGTLWACGYNSNGELGNGTTKRLDKLTQIGNDIDWIKVFAFSDHSFAIKKDGSLWAWGYDYGGQLGLGDDRGKMKKLVPTKVE